MEKVKNVDKKMLLDFMNRLSFFEVFSTGEKENIVNFHTQCFVYRKNELIIKEGDTDTTFFIILSGSVCVIKNDAAFPIAKIDSGDFFGEISFLTKKPRTSNIIADETVIVLKVDKRMLNLLSADIREKIKDKIIDKLIIRLDHMNNALISLAY